MTDKTAKPTPPEGVDDLPRRKGVHEVDPLESLDLQAELDGLLSDLDELDLNDGGPREGDAPTVQLDSELNVVDKASQPPPKKTKSSGPVGPPPGLEGGIRGAGLRPKGGLPSDASEALDNEIELSDDDFLKELGFGETAEGGDNPDESMGFLDGPPPTATPKEVQDLRARVEELEAELEKTKTRHQRAAADFDNMRKRMHREKADSIQFANDKLVKDLLTVLDNFELALEHADGSKPEQVVDGVRMVQKLMLQQLAKYGLEPFDSKGKPFDPRRHEAMAQVPNGDVAPNTVLEVAQRGYFLYQRLLRPSLVTVSMAMPAGAKMPEHEAEEAAATVEALDAVDGAETAEASEAESEASEPTETEPEAADAEPAEATDAEPVEAAEVEAEFEAVPAEDAEAADEAAEEAEIVAEVEVEEDAEEVDPA